MLIGLIAFTILGAWFAVTGWRLLRNSEGWGLSYVERTVPRVFRMGTPDTHRKIVGVGWLLMGTLFAAIGIVFLATHL